MTAVKAGTLIVAGIALAPCVANAAIIDESWDGYANGAEPAPPWVLQDTRNLSAAVDIDPDSVTIQNGWALIDNVGTDTGNYNPILRRSFAATTEALNISFDYRIPSNYGSGSALLFNLFDSAGTTAAQIVLGRNWVANGISSRNAAGTYQTVGHTFSANEVVNIALTNIDLATDTFDLTWSSSQGTSGGMTGLGFRSTAATNFAAIAFGESSAESSVSQLYVDNISVAVVPEPAAIGWVLLAAIPLSQRRRRR